MPCACDLSPADDKPAVAGTPIVVDTFPAAADTASEIVASPIAAPPVTADSFPASVITDSLILTIPVEGIHPWDLRDGYGDPRTGHAHEALDIMAPRGTPVISATDGRLLKLFLSKPGGIMVYAADASDRYILMYGHLDRYAEGLVEGMPLTRGQLLGYVGSTGDAIAAGPHLHFAIARGEPKVKWWKGEPVNPYPLLYRPRTPPDVHSSTGRPIR